MKVRAVTFAFIVFPFLLIAGCNGQAVASPLSEDDPATGASASDNQDASPALLPQDIREVVDGNNEFGMELYRTLGERQTGNLVLSPYGVRLGLAMAFAGAREETKKQMARTLHLTLPDAKIHPAIAMANRTVLGDKQRKCQFKVVNRLWGQRGHALRPRFLETIRQNYGADVQLLDFAENSENARQAINGWIEQKTERKVSDLIGPGVLNPKTVLLLTDAVYFKGRWEEAFWKDFTKEAPFHLLSGEGVIVPMMRDRRLCSYYEGEGVQAVALDYADQEFSMILLLPKEIGGLAALEHRLTPQRLRQSLPRRAREVVVYIPRFRLVSQTDIRGALKSMGMNRVFQPQEADFSNMSSSGPLYISAVMHKAYVDLDEKGTEAAAATSVEIAASPAREEGEEPAVFRADHPFLFLIQENKTGSVIFVGRVANPKG
ncbi:MAG: serpin family protein [Thermoguttaceae bacterium]|jgi:serpin B